MLISDPIKLCAVFYNTFEKIQKKFHLTLEETTLLGILMYLLKPRDIKAISRNEIPKWLGFSETKIDNLVTSLCKKKAIKKDCIKLQGKKKLFFRFHDYLVLNENPIYFKKLEFLIRETGSLNSALLFSKIAYGVNKSKISFDNINYFYCTKDKLKERVGVSIRTLDLLIQSLEKKELIKKENRTKNGRRLSHFCIPKAALNSLNKKLSTAKAKKQNCISYFLPVTTGKIHDIYNRKNKETVYNNNTKAFPKDRNKQKVINFSNFPKKELNPRQKNHLESSLKRTIDSFGLKISNPKELIEQLKFYLTNPQQMKGIETFQHAINRAMKIIRDGNWKTPFGFYTHDDRGKQRKKNMLEKDKQWQQEKHQGYSSNLEPSPNQSDPVTEEAFEVIDTLSKLSKQSPEKGLREIFELKRQELNVLLSKGADKLKVRQYLEQKNQLAS